MKTRIADCGPNSYENHNTSIYDAEIVRLNGLIRHLEDLIERSVVLDKKNFENGEINFDDIVTLYVEESGKPGQMLRVQLSGNPVGENKKDGITKITPDSPMGKAIYGRNVGEIVEYTVERPRYKFAYKATIIAKEDGLSKEQEAKQPTEE